MKKTNTNYVATTLDQFLNENRNITLTRKYGSKEPVVVSSKAPIRNQVLQYVAENVKVTKNALKRFMESLNENNSKPASISMWMKRNEQYFISETKNNVTTYKLSALGKKLVTNIGLNEGCNCGSNLIKKPAGSKTKNQKRINETFNSAYYDDEEVTPEEEEEWVDRKKSDHDFEDNGEKGIYDEKEEESYEGAKKVIEAIKARKVNESIEEEETEEEETEEEETEEEETEEEEDDDKVEITEFILSVDDAESAIAELAELGITAERVTAETDEEFGDSIEDEEFGEPIEDEEFSTEEIPSEDLEDDDIEDDFDLGDLGDIEGEEIEESVNEEDEEFGDSVEDEEFGDSVEDEEFGDSVEDEEFGDSVEDEEFGDSVEDEEFDNNQIKVSAENWGALKGWLEAKGVDTKELFGGEIVEEGEEIEDDGIEEEIDFDSLENLEEYDDKKSKPVGKKDEETDDDEDEDTEDDKKDDGKKKWNFEK